jgi:hypothetical protein
MTWKINYQTKNRMLPFGFTGLGLFVFGAAALYAARPAPPKNFRLFGSPASGLSVRLTAPSSSNGTSWGSSGGSVKIAADRTIMLVGIATYVDFGTGTVGIGASSAFLASFTDSGGYRYSVVASGTSAAVDLALDPLGEAVVLGSFSTRTDFGGISLTPTGFRDGFIARYTR